MRSFSAALVFSLPTLHHNKMFPLYGVIKGSTAGSSRKKLTKKSGIQQWINSFNKIPSDQTRMNGIGLTSRSDVRLPPPTDVPCHVS